MAQFVIPEWAMGPDAPDAAAPPLPPPDPIVAREDKIANDTRVEEALNDFLTARQGALFEAPDAFYRTEGKAAIHAAPVTTQALGQLRTDLLDGLANDYERKRLGTALDAQMQVTRDGMARHVAEQSLAWQRSVAQNRIAILTKEAVHHHNHDELIDALGHAAATAARAHARVGEGPPGGEAEDAAAAQARSGVLGAAIQARLDRGDSEGANALFTQIGDQLHPEHAAPLQAQLDTVQRLDAAKVYAGQLVPVWSNASHEEIDAQHATATRQNQTDNAADLENQDNVQHVLDVQRGLQKRSFDQSDAPQSNQEVLDWLSRTGADGLPQTERPSAALWNTLGPEERAAVDRQLAANARGEVPDAIPPGQAQLIVAPGSIEEAATDASAPQPPDQESGAEMPPSGVEIPPQGSDMVMSPPSKAAVVAPSILSPQALDAAKAAAAELGRVIARVAPRAGRVASAGGLAGTILLVPSNTQATVTKLGEGLRIRSAPGQRTVTIERQADNGLFGTGIGAKWKELPVDAEHATAPDGRSIVVINPQQLEREIGVDAMGRIAPQAVIAMARPPRNDDDKKRSPGIGHNSQQFPSGDNNPPPIPATPLGTPERKKTDLDKQALESNDLARKIAMHAYQEHVVERNEFPGIRSLSDFSAHIENVMRRPTDSFADGDRKVYWDGPSQTFVATDPILEHGGSAFKPTGGRAYYEEQKAIARARQMQKR